MKSSKQLREEIGALCTRIETIADTANAEGRELNASERTEIERIQGRGRPGEPNYSRGLLGSLEDELSMQDRTDELRERYKAGEPINPIRPTQAREPDEHPAATWRDSSGKAVRMFRPTDRLAKRNGMSLGNVARSLITGNPSHAENERRFLATMTTNGTAGFLVDDELSGTVIDLARANTVCIAAGALTVPMNMATLTLAKVTGDPDFEIKGEGLSFTGSSVDFGAMNLEARTIGTVVTISRELAQDAPNAGQLIENALSQALAVELDRLALNGATNAHPQGLAQDPNVGETGSVGAIAWEDLLTAISAIEAANGTPNAWVVSPTIKNDLALLTSGDGTNAAKMWLPAPPDVAALSRYVTSSCPDTKIFAGDFSQLVFGLRQDPLLEVSTDASDSFDKHTVRIKLTWRGDVGIMRPDHFHRLVGITT